MGDLQRHQALLLQEGFAGQWCCISSLELLGFTAQVEAVVLLLLPALVGTDVAYLVSCRAVPG